MDKRKWVELRSPIYKERSCPDCKAPMVFRDKHNFRWMCLTPDCEVIGTRGQAIIREAVKRTFPFKTYIPTHHKG